MTVVTPYEELTRTVLSPFGLLVEAKDGMDLAAVPPALLARWAGEHRIVILRGFNSPEKEGFVECVRPWGPLLKWDFGEVLDLVVQEDPKNYLFTSGDVPYHWDGAFAERAPSYMFFHCLQAPLADTGGETSFCDTTRLMRNAPPERRELWERITITYSTDKAGHLGGEFSQPLVQSHPITGAATLRYAEPLNAEGYGKPLFLEIDGISTDERDDLLNDLRERLYRDEVNYTHTWQDGDLLLADNHAVLHARAPFKQGSPRHLQRVHVL